tara:strand:+ start:214 stop:741 length:528 start_codon:yes stop_codon:yes gene_type:complete
MTNKQNAIDIINTYVQDSVEYETTHVDSGENYSFLVKESWDNQSTSDLLWSLEQLKVKWDTLNNSDVDSRYKHIDLDILIDIALESFTMKPDSSYEPSCGSVVLDSFPVGEIEVCLSEVELPEGVNLDDIEDDCDCYIPRTSYGYIDTESEWLAVLDVSTFNQLIEQYFERSIDD